MWDSTLEIVAAQPRFFTEIAPKSLFLCVNRTLSGMVFRGGAKAIRYCANITFNNEISTRPGRLFYLQIFLHFSTLFSLMNSLNQ